MNCPWALEILYPLMWACLHFWCTRQYQPDGKPLWTWGRPSYTPAWSSLPLQSPEKRSRWWEHHTRSLNTFLKGTVHNVHLPPPRFEEIEHSIICSAMDPLKWMGAVRMRVQTADTNNFIPNMQLLASQDVNWWTGVVWIILMFLSSVWTLILTAPIHCRGSIGEQEMQCYISPNLFQWTNKLHLGWPEAEWIFSTFSFLVNYSFSMTTVAPSWVFSNKTVSPAVHQPWNTPPLLGTALCFLWFCPGRTSWCGFHTRMIALIPASPTP